MKFELRVQLIISNIGPGHRRLLQDSSKDVIEDLCAGLFQICDAYVTHFLVFDEFLFYFLRFL